MQNVLILALVFAGLGYYFYTPCPEGFKEPWKTSLHLSLLNVLAVPAIVLDKLGLDAINFDRYFWDAVFPYTHNTASLDAQFVTEDTEIEGVPARLYRLKSAGNDKALQPALVFFHGGGWVYCSYLVHDSTVKRMALDLGMSAIAMNYRLAPEHPYPTPLEDALKVTKYYLNNAAAQFGVDPDRVVFAGDSAGGQIATTVTMKLAAEDFPHRPRVLALIYPDIQSFNLHTPSYEANRDGPFLTQLDMAFYWAAHSRGRPDNAESFLASRHVPRRVAESVAHLMPLDALPDADGFKTDYAGPNYPEESTLWDEELEEVIMDPFFSPLLASDELLRKFPPTYVNACQHDVVRDDAIWYARRIQAARRGGNTTSSSDQKTTKQTKDNKAGKTKLGEQEKIQSDDDDDVMLDLHNCFHGWTLYTEDLVGAQEAMDRVTAFIRKHLR